MTLAELFGAKPQKKTTTEALVESQLARIASARLVKTVKKER